MCFFIIATINRQKYKKEYIVFTIAGVISFSLAFYILYILLCLSKIKISNIKYLIIPLTLYAVFNVPINDFIVDRIMLKWEDGTLDNRNSLKMNRLFDEMCSSGEITFGIGNRTFYDMQSSYDMGASTGVKNFMMQYGVLGTCLFLSVFAYAFFRYNKLDYPNVVVFVLIGISFYQRADLIIETNIVVLFSYSLVDGLRQPRLNKQRSI